MSSRHGVLADVVEFSCVDGPGNRFVVFLQGCNFECIACHNPHTIAVRSSRATDVSVEELVERVRPLAPFLSGITVSGGEATRQAGFVKDFFTAVQQDPELGSLTRFVDSNGCAPPHTWQLLLPVMDAAMIDLKALDPLTHHLLTGRSNEAVLASIELLARAGRLYEVRLLLVPGFNDSADALERTGEWLARVAPATRLKVIGFRAHGTNPPAAQWPDEAPAELERAEGILRNHGFTDVLVV
jgi:pyruvate-formate lyase-activating enzyme